MSVSQQEILSSESMAAFVREFASHNRNVSEKVIYYRKGQKTMMGHPYQEAGWITWADSQIHKQMVYWMKGWTPLPQFGYIQDSGLGNNAFDQYGPWGPILTHTDGPAQFPIDQILTYRWHTEDGLRGSCKGALPPNVQFPQLNGVKVTEYRCPDCQRRYYRELFDLALHLRNAHGYDRAALIALGTQYGLDFSRKIAVNTVVVDYSDQAPRAEPAPSMSGPKIEIIEPTIPTESSPKLDNSLCLGVKKNGEPCSTKRVLGQLYCGPHLSMYDPSYIAARVERKKARLGTS